MEIFFVHCKNAKSGFYSRLQINSQLSRCRTAKGSSARFFGVSPTKVKAGKPFLFTENFPCFENKEHLLDFVITFIHVIYRPLSILQQYLLIFPPAHDTIQSPSLSKSGIFHDMPYGAMQYYCNLPLKVKIAEEKLKSHRQTESHIFISN